MLHKRSTCLAAVLLLLASCGRSTTTTTNLNGRGFGGEDTVASSLLSNRLRAANAITTYLNSGDPNNHLCDPTQVSGESFLASNLSVLTSDATGGVRANLNATMLGRTELMRWRDALLGATMKISDNASDVTTGGVVHDAYTVGLNITYYRAHVEPMSELRRLALELHEATHAETSGWTDTQMIGNMVGLQAIDLRAACFAAYEVYLESQPTTQVVDEFVDEFNATNGTGLSSSWHNRNLTSVVPKMLNGFLIPSADGEVWAEVVGLSRKDMHVRSTINFDCVYTDPNGCWAHLEARDTGTTNYTAGIGRTGNTIRLSLWYFDGTNFNQLASGAAITIPTGASATYDIDFSVVGSTLSASLGGTSVSITDTHITAAGTAGIRFSDVSFDRFEVSDP